MNDEEVAWRASKHQEEWEVGDTEASKRGERNHAKPEEIWKITSVPDDDPPFQIIPSCASADLGRVEKVRVPPLPSSKDR